MMQKRIALLLCVALLLCGCNQKQEDAPVSSYIWETMPALDYGSMEYEKLEVLPWYCGRCEATGDGGWAETEMGYYLLYDFTLFYADKADLSNWVVVCNQPDCTHSKTWSYGQTICNAQVSRNSFLMIDGRIYTDESSDSYSELKLADGFCNVLFSRAADGTDRRREYYVEDTVSHGGGSSSSILNYQYWLQSVSIFNPDGSYTQRLYCTTRDSEYLLTEYTMEENFGHSLASYGATNVDSNGLPVFISGPGGDPTFFTTVFGDNRSVLYRFRNGALEAPHIMDYAAQWQYLSGDTLRIFRPGDGYYDVNIQTKEEVNVGNIRLNGGISSMVLPNCMLANTVNLPELAEGQTRALEVFDGQQWRNIQLPEELVNSETGASLGLACVASDRMLFFRIVGKEYHIYQVMLDREELALEYCGSVNKMPI